MIADTIIARLKANVEALGQRVDGAAALAPLIDGNELPATTPAAFVIPLGLDAGRAESSTGTHRQMMHLQWGVLLVIDYAGDVTGVETMPEVGELAKSIREALAGFQPGSDGVLDLKRERLVKLSKGTAFYQLDFNVDEQLRIIS